MMNDKRKKNKGFLSRIKNSIPLLAGLALLLFIFLIYAPLELLYGNEYEFSYNMYDVLLYMLPVFIVSTCVCVAIILPLTRRQSKLYFPVVAVLFTAGIATYIQGTFLSGNLPPLDGRTIVWKDYADQRITSIILWVCVAATVFFLLKKLGTEKFGKIAAFVSSFLIMMLGFSLLLTCFSTGGYHRNRQVVHSESYMMDLSDHENLVVFLVDAVDGETFREVLAEHPEYKEIFADFTSFTNVSSAYPYTSRAIPFILSGQWYENEIPYGEYCKEAFSSSSLFKQLKQRDYRMGLYDPELYFIPGLEEQFENISPADHFSSVLQFIKMQILMSGYRYLPFDLKPLCYLTPDEIYSSSAKTSGLGTLYTADNEEFFNRLQLKEVTLAEENCFRFIYIRGAHEPFIYPAQSAAFENNSYESSIEMSVSIAAEYLEKLKSSGVYDSTAVVFLADHGYAPDNASFGRQNPFLLIKGRNESHPFSESAAPVSHEDLQQCFMRLLDGADGASAFDWQEGEARDRRFLFFEYEKEDMIWEYTLSGEASDESALSPTGKVYEYRA